MDLPSELTEDNIENVIICTRNSLIYRSSYEWIHRVYDNKYVSGLKIMKHQKEDGDIEMVVDIGETDTDSVETIIKRFNESDDMKIIGYAEENEEAREIAKKHYLNNFN